MKPIFDNGHGGIIGGAYQTAGKRSPNWENGILYEGAFNRWVVNRLIEKMDRIGLAYYHISPELTDVSLNERVKRANEIYQKDKEVYILSIHANAGGGTGIEAFTSKGKTISDGLAEIILTNFEADLKCTTMRFDLSDGDKDKEENFQILRSPYCPAVLVECGFMDNRSDYNKLWSHDYLNKLTESIFRSILEIYKSKK